MEIEHKEDGLRLKTYYGLRQEALKRNGIPLSYFIGAIEMWASKEFDTDYINELGANMIEDARQGFLAKTPEEEIAKYIEEDDRFIKARTKGILAELEEKKFFNELRKMDISELVEVINSFGVFNATIFGSSINVSTSMTLSKASWNRCRKLNDGKYLPKVDFNINAEASAVYEIIDISRKTRKFSQETLQKMKKDRLTRKHSGTPSTKRKGMSFAEWYREADIPEKINGVWVDLETGLLYDDFK